MNVNCIDDDDTKGIKIVILSRLIETVFIITHSFFSGGDCVTHNFLA